MAAMATTTATKALYLDDTYRLDGDARVLGVEPGEQEGEHVVILDQTLFYPQGGGQPADHGTMTCGSTTFNVRHVSKNRETLLISHIGAFQGHARFAPGDQVHMKIDGERRLLHARYHLGGHLLDLALLELGVYSRWQSLTGNHSPDGAFVEFRPEEGCPPERIAEIVQQMQGVCNSLIKRDLRSSVINIRPGDVPNDAQRMMNDYMKGMEQVRMNRVDGIHDYWMPCGGTLPCSLGEIGGIVLTKHSYKKGLLRISYRLI